MILVDSRRKVLELLLTQATAVKILTKMKRMALDIIVSSRLDHESGTRTQLTIGGTLKREKFESNEELRLMETLWLPAKLLRGKSLPLPMNCECKL